MAKRLDKMYFFGSQETGVRNYLEHLFRGEFQGLSFSSMAQLEEDYCVMNARHQANSFFLLTGSGFRDLKTNRPTLDLEAILYARKHGLTNVSVVEHWSWFSQRFKFGKRNIFPDYIFLNDQAALLNAIREGYPAHKLFAPGNPVLENLAASRTSVSGFARSRLRQYFQLPEDRNLILFISENLVGDVSEDGAALLPFNEYDVFEMVSRFAQDEGALVVVKPHPTDISNKYGAASKDLNYLPRIPLPARDLATLPDKVMGIGSMLLIEISMLRQDVISIIPSGREHFTGLELTDIQVYSSLKHIDTIPLAPRNFRLPNKRFIGSADKIRKLLDGM